MCYGTFRNIVGEEKIKLFQNFSGKTDDDCTDFILLYKLWKEFHTVRKEPENNTSREESNEMDPTEYQDESNLTTIGNQLELGQNNIHMSEPSGPTMPNHEDLFRDIEERKCFGYNLELVDLENIPIIFNDMPMQIESNVIIEEVQTMADENNDDIQNNVPINLENVLKYAKTPQRKGERNTERTSFVITGTSWRENKRKQEEEKLAKELEKKEKNATRTKISKNSKKS
ncbi:hypothetical protein JTB14_029168 [Gonioctena quinquepunctata]|nr:hypothetical protein JTB14_029168 [Gonioctena quinquepunctata]